MRIGALEAGGTKMVCAIGNEKGEILERVTIPTESPDITMPRLIAFFKDKDLKAIGIGSFGPIDLNKNSITFGHILKSSKTAWQNYDLLGHFKRELKIPIGIDTDVNASALGEAVYGSTQGLSNSIYITIGTGVGVGVFLNGQLHHGMLHPEGGHILVNRKEGDTYQGKCPFHKNCLEGLACGPAIEERWGKKGIELSQKKEVWELEAYYIAQALVNYAMLLSPERIVLGGGVMHQNQLYDMVRASFKTQLNGYLSTKEIDDLNTYICAPQLGDDQGIMGCLELGMNALEQGEE